MCPCFACLFTLFPFNYLPARYANMKTAPLFFSRWQHESEKRKVRLVKEKLAHIQASVRKRFASTSRARSARKAKAEAKAAAARAAAGKAALVMGALGVGEKWAAQQRRSEAKEGLERRLLAELDTKRDHLDAELEVGVRQREGKSYRLEEWSQSEWSLAGPLRVPFTAHAAAVTFGTARDDSGERGEEEALELGEWRDEARRVDRTRVRRKLLTETVARRGEADAWAAQVASWRGASGGIEASQERVADQELKAHVSALAERAADKAAGAEKRRRMRLDVRGLRGMSRERERERSGGEGSLMTFPFLRCVCVCARAFVRACVPGLAPPPGGASRRGACAARRRGAAAQGGGAVRGSGAAATHGHGGGSAAQRGRLLGAPNEVGALPAPGGVQGEDLGREDG